MARGRDERFHIGFLTAIELDAATRAGGGFVGGLLVTNHLGRPLEFQCTTPVKPNRTQAILYGPTLRPFVVGELIGGTLLERTSVKPDLLLVEDADQLSLAEHVSMAVARIVGEDDAIEPQRTLHLGRQLLLCAEGVDVAALERRAEAIPSEADLAEPFERVREALQETMRAAA